MAKAYDKILMPGEEMSFVLRPHWRFIVAGVTIGIIVIIGWWFWAGLWREWLGDAARFPQILGALIALFLLIRYTLRPLMQWIFTRYYFTTARVMTRSGVLVRRAADIPLDKISNIYYEQKITDRLLGCGDLLIDSSGGDGFRIENVPSVERVTRDVHVLVEGGRPAERLHGKEGVAPNFMHPGSQHTYPQQPLSPLGNQASPQEPFRNPAGARQYSEPQYSPQPPQQTPPPGFADSPPQQQYFAPNQKPNSQQNVSPNFDSPHSYYDEPGSPSSSMPYSEPQHSPQPPPSRRPTPSPQPTQRPNTPPVFNLPPPPSPSRLQEPNPNVRYSNTPPAPSGPRLARPTQEQSLEWEDPTEA